MHRPGRVGGDEFEVDDVPGQGLAAPVPLPRLDHGSRQLARARGVQHDVQEAGARDVDALHPGQLGQPEGDQLGDLPRRPAGPLGQLERDVGGPVAVLALLGSLDPYLGGHVDVELARSDGRPQAGPDGGG